MKYRNLLLDLDGTLTDAAPGIVASIRYALESLVVHTPADDELAWTVGPPIRGSLALLLGTEDDAIVEDAVGRYRERFSTLGWLENSLYDGVPEALTAIKAQRIRMLLATSKPHVYAHKILDHFGIAPFFDGVYGSELDGTHGDKTTLIEWLLRREQLDPAECLMIGDREHDVHGARANEVDCVGVTYGYGSEAELLEAGAVALATTPMEWAEYVLG